MRTAPYTAQSVIDEYRARLISRDVAKAELKALGYLWRPALRTVTDLFTGITYRGV